MNKRNSILMSLAIFTALVLGGCNGSSKGKWSQADHDKFTKEMEGVDLSNLGDNKTKWIDCYYKKAEANYSSFAEADADIDGCKKLALECSNDILSNGSVKGKWSDADKEQFNKEMEKVDLSALGENKTKWIECYLSKAEAKYSSFYEANQDEPGCKVLAEECNAEVLK